MPVSKKQLEYARKYQSKFDDIKIRVPSGVREQWRQIAESKGLSLNQFIIQCVDSNIKR